MLKNKAKNTESFLKKVGFSLPSMAGSMVMGSFGAGSSLLKATGGVGNLMNMALPSSMGKTLADLPLALNQMKYGLYGRSGHKNMNQFLNPSMKRFDH